MDIILYFPNLVGSLWMWAMLHAPQVMGVGFIVTMAYALLKRVVS